MATDSNDSSKDNLENKLTEIETKIQDKLILLSKELNGIKCIPLFLGDISIGDSLVDDIFDELRTKHNDCDGKLNVIIESGGGELDAAYNISHLLRRYANKELNFIVPRWAKSAATLLVCSGDNIYMTPVAELGPLDPQITVFNPIEKRIEQFSPLSIEATLELIREEYKKGNKKLANGLLERLQFPLTLGTFKKSLEDSEQYLTKLLETRMLKDIPNRQETIKKIAEQLVRNYSHHGFCINAEEAGSIGLKVTELTGIALDTVWEIHKLNKEKAEIKRKPKKEDSVNPLEDLSPDIFNKPKPSNGELQPNLLNKEK